MMRPQNPPKVPTMPQGNEIAVYTTYLKAQQAVDKLSDVGFAVQGVTIVGHDLHMVERVLGRLTYPRIAMAGFASGAWFGVFVGLLLSLFGDGQTVVIFTALLVGGAFGLLFSVLSYALTRGKRDFTSSSQIVAARYVLLCIPQSAAEARALLQTHGVAGDWVPNPTGYYTPSAQGSASYGAGPAAQDAPAPGPQRTYGQAIDESGGKAVPQAPARPQYGAMRPVEPNTADAADGNSAPAGPAGDGGEDLQTTQVRKPRDLENPDNPFSPPKE